MRFWGTALSHRPFCSLLITLFPPEILLGKTVLFLGTFTMAWSLCELILVGIWPALPYLTLPLGYMTVLWHDPDLQWVRDLLSLPKPLLPLASAFWWWKLRLPQHCWLKQGHCAGNTVPWLRGRQCRRQCAGQDDRYWDSVSIVQYPVALKLIHICDFAVLGFLSSCDSVCFGSVSLTANGRLRNR